MGRKAIFVGPRERGERARAALAQVPDAVRTAIDRLVEKHAAVVNVNPRSLVPQLTAVARHPAVIRWGDDVERQSGGRLTGDDARAAAVALYLRAAMARPALGGSYQRQMGHMLIGILEPAIRMARLDVLKPPLPGVTGADSPRRPLSDGQRFLHIYREIRDPLAAFVLQSLADLRLRTDLLVEDARDDAQPPVAWSPGRDGFWGALRRLVLKQEQEDRFLPGDFLQSAFARLTVQMALARTVRFQVHYCERCRQYFVSPEDPCCPFCGRELRHMIQRRLLGMNYLEMCIPRYDDRGRAYFAPPDARADRRLAEHKP